MAKNIVHFDNRLSRRRAFIEGEAFSNEGKPIYNGVLRICSLQQNFSLPFIL